ncbi:MAG TPA: transglycosylase SLT domain-containing protein [Longimicrobiales bacterium]|nr:transglycosylase SLT domain-containing protein [Longimicrobiales bacterium]
MMKRILLVLGVVLTGLASGAALGWSAPGTALRPSLEEARRELELGRHWHAAQLLRALEREEGLDAEGRVLLAEALAGYRSWEGVRNLLTDPDWSDDEAPLRGPYLLGRAEEALGDVGAAATAYGRAFLASTDPSFELTARLARTRYRAGSIQDALPYLDGLAERDDVAAGLVGGLAWEMAGEAASEGDSAAVTVLLPRITVPEMQRRSRPYAARAVLEAGDSARAEELYTGLLETAEGDGERAGYAEQVASLALARGDTVTATALFLEAFESAPRSGAGTRAAAHVVDHVELDVDLTLEAARALDRAGDGTRALRAYDRYVALTLAAGEEPRAAARVERARLAATVPERVEEAVEEFRALDEHPDPTIGVRTLEVWTALRRRQGQTGNVRTLRQWLVERYPDTDAAAQIVFLRGDDAQDRGDLEAAVREYERVAEMAPSRTLAGLARMRIGQIRLAASEWTAAAETFETYLNQFPEGRRWAEASFWAGHARAAAGDVDAAGVHFDRVLAGDPFSYYGALSAAESGRSYPPTLAATPTAMNPAWVDTALIRLDLLEAAGLAAAAEFHVDRLQERVAAEGGAARYALAEGLIERGRTIEGINQGWALIREGDSWNPRLLRIVYPYPNREMVEREAEEWGVDPFLMAGLIRQESAWDHDIVSSAGAVGLMQVMPATGAQLARSIGPDGFSRESLESAEVNLHLGARFLRDMLDRFGPDLPLVLSAYNAGPTRASRWRSFPEHADPLRFTERIPFTETRGYVKNVTRNRDLYRALYAEDQDVSSP